MTGRQVTWAWGALFLALGGLSLGLTIGQESKKKDAPPAVAAETLIPENSILFVHFDGNGPHKDAWEKTAAYKAFYGSGLMESLQKIFQSFSENNPAPEEQKKYIDALKGVAERCTEKGLLFSISLPADGSQLPQAILVARDCAEFEPTLAEAATKFGEQGNMAFEDKEIEGRKAKVGVIPGSPGVQVAWWTEGSHLVVAAGLNAAESMIDVAAKKTPNVTTNPNFKKHVADKPKFEVISTSWLDLGALRKTFGDVPLPAGPKQDKALHVSDILKATGLDTMGAIISQQGYNGEALWSESFIETDGPRTGLMSLADEAPITLKDLPPFPWDLNGFIAGSCNFSKMYDTFLGVARNVAKLAPEQEGAQIEGTIEKIPDMVGFDPKKDLLDALGNVYAVYNDNRGGLFGLDFSTAIKVKDPKTLRKTLDKLVGMASEQAGEDMIVRRTKKHGREIVTLELAKGFFNPSFVVDENWVSFGLYPQTVESFLLRLDGKLSVWEPSESYREAFAALPKEFTSISVADPRRVYRGLMGMAPMLMPFAQMAMNEAAKRSGVGGPDGFKLPVTLADLPPGELVARPLFPNVSMCTVEDGAIRYHSRQSAPGIPLLGGGDAVSGVGTTAVLVALLLPAVQSARQAARRTQSINNLKQLMLALHNYHDANAGFPEGARVSKNKELKVDQQMSWFVSIMPYLDQPFLLDQINDEEAWDSETNGKVAATPIPTLRNPGVVEKGKPNYATTHYVGIGGLGADGPTLGVKDKKAGAFGYNRVTKISDFRDGTSNTIMVGEASKDFGPWAAAGSGTIRPFTKKPYINGPDGIGGPYKGGASFGFADGSVRFISESVDPSVIEAISTINGGEKVDAFGF